MFFYVSTDCLSCPLLDSLIFQLGDSKAHFSIFTRSHLLTWILNTLQLPQSQTTVNASTWVGFKVCCFIVISLCPSWMSAQHFVKLCLLSVTWNPQGKTELSARKQFLQNMLPYRLYCHIHAFLFRGYLLTRAAMNFKLDFTVYILDTAKNEWMLKIQITYCVQCKMNRGNVNYM